MATTKHQVRKRMSERNRWIKGVEKAKYKPTIHKSFNDGFNMGYKKGRDYEQLQLKRELEEIKKAKEKRCLICGSKNNVTIHHMRDIHSKKNKKKPTLNGLIYLCRDCHDIVEDVVNKGKSKRIWYHKGYQQGIIDTKNEGGQK